MNLRLDRPHPAAARPEASGCGAGDGDYAAGCIAPVAWGFSAGVGRAAPALSRRAGPGRRDRHQAA